MAARHLIAIPSPPDDHESDNMTLGPVLPAGWEGDSWNKEDTSGNSYWLRAWNKSTGRFSIAQADKYESARQMLLDDIDGGGAGETRITISGS